MLKFLISTLMFSVKSFPDVDAEGKLLFAYNLYDNNNNVIYWQPVPFSMREDYISRSPH